MSPSPSLLPPPSTFQYLGHYIATVYLRGVKQKLIFVAYEECIWDPEHDVDLALLIPQTVFWWFGGPEMLRHLFCPSY